MVPPLLPLRPCSTERQFTLDETARGSTGLRLGLTLCGNSVRVVISR